MYVQWETSGLSFSLESGEITGEILVKILTYFDDINSCPRHPGGPILMLIVDGHQSCLNPGFIEISNDLRHK